MLIIAEDDVDSDVDGLVDDPDDEVNGGSITFRFDDPVRLGVIGLLDLEGNEADGNYYRVKHSDDSTEQNGIETAAWALRAGCRRIWLVTDDLHLRRAEVELAARLDDIAILPWPLPRSESGPRAAVRSCA